MITIYTDGACRNNQSRENIGAWAYYAVYDDLTAEHAKAVPNTTNNRMELTAVIEALKEALTDSDEPTTLYSDSTYVIQRVNEWHKGWIKKNWKGVANTDLWEQLLALKANFKNITFIHIRGHAGHKENEYVDELCNNAMDNYKENKKQMTPEERLVEEIFKDKRKEPKYEGCSEDECPYAEACGRGEGFPYTGAEKADYAEFLIIKALEYISPALRRLSRLNGLYKAMRKDKLPDIIAHNEAKMALKYIAELKASVDEAYGELMYIFENEER